MKRAGVYCRSDLLIVQTHCETADGLYTAWGKPVVLPTKTPSPLIGVALLKALDESKRGVLHPTDWKAHYRPLFESVGVKRWSAFVEGAKSCSVETEAGRILFEPEGYREDYRAFVAIKGAQFSVPLRSSAAEIGAALLRALDQSIPKGGSLSRVQQRSKRKSSRDNRRTKV